MRKRARSVNLGLVHFCGGDGGESNSPSNGRDPESTTGLFRSLISLEKPQLNKSVRASRLVFRRPYRHVGGGTPTLHHPGPDPPGWGQAGWASLFSQPEPIQVRQLFFATCLMRVMAPQPAILWHTSTVETTRPRVCVSPSAQCLFKVRSISRSSSRRLIVSRLS